MLTRQQAPNKPFRITLVADGQEEQVNLWARVDTKLPRSVISQQKVSETKGTITPTTSLETYKDSNGTTYSPRTSLALRYRSQGSSQSFQELFEIVDNCQPDVVLRWDIKTESVNSEPGYHPVFLETQKEGMKDHK